MEREREMCFRGHEKDPEFAAKHRGICKDCKYAAARRYYARNFSLLRDYHRNRRMRQATGQTTA